MLERYADVTGSVLSRGGLQDLLRSSSADAGRVALYLETYDALLDQQPSEAEFKWSLQQLRELAAEEATGSALTQALEILTKGARIGRDDLRGHHDARSYVFGAFADLESRLTMHDSPEGDMRLEGVDIKADYAKRKQERLSGRPTGVYFGIPEIDSRTGGLQRGELDLLVAYSSDGKTTTAVQLAWHAAVRQGLNVYFATTETLRPQVRRKIIARHSMESHFELPDGLNTADLKSGTLPELLEQKFFQVVDDLERNAGYGKLYVAQMPRGSTVKTLEAKLYRTQRSWPIDLVVVDYLALFQPERRSANEWAMMGSILKDAKQLAATFDDGMGVPVVSPWQTSRAAWDEAQRSGFYTLKALSDTAEAEKSSDVILSILRLAEAGSIEGRKAELRAQLLKNRDGEQVHNISLEVDYATCTVQEKRRSTAMSSLLDDEDL